MHGGVVALASAIAIALLLAFAHVHRHAGGPRDPSDCEIVQRAASGVTPDVLARRVPVVVQDRMVDPGIQLSETVLRWQFASAHGPDELAPSPAHTTVARFTLLWFAREGGGSVDMRPATLGRDVVPDTQLRLGGGMALILPPGWLYAAASPSCRRLQLHDLTSGFRERLAGGRTARREACT